MENLQVLNFENATVRTVIKDGEIWFVAKDICNILELSDVSMSVQRLDDDEKGTNTIRTPGGNQEMLTVNESGVYHLIFTSTKPEARKFRKWVTTEVLPSIRKTGSFQPSVDIQEFYELALNAKAAARNGVEQWWKQRLVKKANMELIELGVREGLTPETAAAMFGLHIVTATNIVSDIRTLIAAEKRRNDIRTLLKNQLAEKGGAQ